MTDQKHLDTLKKLKALADREDAPPHEREAAAQDLERLRRLLAIKSGIKLVARPVPRLKG